jgi:predicted DNA-binding protein
MKKRYMYLDYLIKYVHFNEKYPQLNNIKITNLRDNIAHKYNDEKKNFITTTKDELISDLINERMHDIKDFTFDEDAFNKLDKRNKQIIADLYEQFMDNDAKLIAV